MARPRGAQKSKRDNGVGRLTVANCSTEIKGLSPASANPSNGDGPPQNETAAQAGPRRGGKTNSEFLTSENYSSSRAAATLFALAAFSSPAGLLPQIAAGRERDRCARLRLNLRQIEWEARS